MSDFCVIFNTQSCQREGPVILKRLRLYKVLIFSSSYDDSIKHQTSNVHLWVFVSWMLYLSRHVHHEDFGYSYGLRIRPELEFRSCCRQDRWRPQHSYRSHCSLLLLESNYVWTWVVTCCVTILKSFADDDVNDEEEELSLELFDLSSVGWSWTDDNADMSIKRYHDTIRWYQVSGNFLNFELRLSLWTFRWHRLRRTTVVRSRPDSKELQ